MFFLAGTAKRRRRWFHHVKAPQQPPNTKKRFPASQATSVHTKSFWNVGFCCRGHVKFEAMPRGIPS